MDKIDNRKVVIGLLGAGGVAKDLHLPALSNMREIRIKWVCDRDIQRGKQLAKLFSIPQVFTDIKQCSDVDIVLVAIPVGFRHTAIKEIFKRGWNAFCEKPFALTLKEFDEYINEANINNVEVGVGLVRRYCPATVLAKKIVQGGHFGPITEVLANEGMRTKRTGREAGFYMFDPKAVGGGVLMETGSHLVDQICNITGADEFELRKCWQKKYNGLEFETKFIGYISNKIQKNIKCSFKVSRVDDLLNGVFIKFEKLIMKCGLGFDSPLELCGLDGKPFSTLKTDIMTENAAFYFEWKDFIKQCTSKNPSIVKAVTARISMEIIEQCYNRAEIINLNNNKVEECYE